MSRDTDYDTSFASRFSAEDAEFQRYRQRAPDTPPVLEDWKARGRRDNRVPEQRHRGGYSRGDRRWPERSDERKSGHDSYGQRSHYRHR
nr:RNA guanine-N7 methyltransferase activating subunit-like [Misgurnus anguillicaudatus]